MKMEFWSMNLFDNKFLFHLPTNTAPKIFWNFNLIYILSYSHTMMRKLMLI